MEVLAQNGLLAESETQITQLSFTCSKSTKDTLGKGVKYVQS